MRGKKLLFLLFAGVVVALFISACSEDTSEEQSEALDGKLNEEELDPDDPETPYIKYGEKIFRETSTTLPETGNDLSCMSCHADGDVTKTISMVGVTTDYPAWRPRENTIFTLEDRINGCMKRSMNGEELDYESDEMRAINAYLTHVSEGVDGDEAEDWLGNDTMEEVPEPDVDRGEELFGEKSCMNCHATDGSGSGMTSGPALWGDGSFNDGAGMNRLSDAAGFIRSYMPKFAPGSLSDQEAADLAAFILSRERPEWGGHDKDWENSEGPPDIMTKDRREEIRNGTFDWTELDNVIPADEDDWSN